MSAAPAGLFVAVVLTMYTAVHASLMVKQQAVPLIGSFAEVIAAGKRVCVSPNILTTMQSLYPAAGLSYAVVESQQLLTNMAAAGCDVAVVERPDAFLSQEKDTRLCSIGVANAEPVLTMTVTMPISPQYEQFFEYALSAARADGTVARAFQLYPFHDVCAHLPQAEHGRVLVHQLLGIAAVFVLFVLAAGILRLTQNNAGFGEAQQLLHDRRVADARQVLREAGVLGLEASAPAPQKGISLAPCEDSGEEELSSGQGGGPTAGATADAHAPAQASDEGQEGDVAAQALATKTQEQELEAECRRVFDKYDDSNDGNVDGAELKHAMQALGEDVSDKHIQDTMAHFDADGSGQLSFAEFYEFVRIHKVRRAHRTACAHVRTGQHTCAPDSMRTRRAAHTGRARRAAPRAAALQNHKQRTRVRPPSRARSARAYFPGVGEVARRGARCATNDRSTSILGRRTVPCSPVFIPNTIPHGFTQDPSTDQSSFNLGADRDYWFNPISKDRTWVDPHDPEARAQNAAVQARPSPFRTRSNTCDAHRVETGPYFRTRITT